jgi:hypothetical protein
MPHQHPAKNAAQRRRPGVHFAGQQEIAIQVDIVFVEPPLPGEAERIQRMDENHRRAWCRSPTRRQTFQVRQLHRGPEKPFDAVHTAGNHECPRRVRISSKGDVDRQRLAVGTRRLDQQRMPLEAEPLAGRQKAVLRRKIIGRIEFGATQSVAFCPEWKQLELQILALVSPNYSLSAHKRQARIAC